MNIVDVYQQDISQFTFYTFLESFPQTKINEIVPVIFLVDDNNDVLGMSTVRDRELFREHYKEIIVQVSIPARDRFITQESSLLNNTFNVLKTHHLLTHVGTLLRPVNKKITKEFLERFGFTRKLPNLESTNTFLYKALVYERLF